MKQVMINCDVGEGVHNEAQLMPYIQACNIACGGHAGDEKLMSTVVQLAIKHQVKVGAHPSYPDKLNFGRKTVPIKAEDLKESIQTQINSLIKVIDEKGANLHHIKAHGALYNDIAKNRELALVFLEAILPYKNEVNIYVPFNSEIEKCAIKNGFKIIYEAFADRNYNDDLSLVSRDKKDAIISEPKAILKHVTEINKFNKVTTITGKKVSIQATTFCVHSDTENAVEIVAYLHKNLMT